jgi:hypothetical protein
MHERAIPVVPLEELQRLAARNPHLLHERPWIVTGYIEEWPGYGSWQDLDFLRRRFGHLRAFAKAPNFVTNRKSRLVSVETSFAQYLDYMRDPGRAGAIYAGCWMEGDHDELVALGLPLYCGTLRIVHRADDGVFDELAPLVPPPIGDWNHALPYYFSLFNHFWLLVSLPGALTPLHRDNNGTIALIAQLQGRKRAVLYSPDDLPHIHNPDVGYLDPLDPDPADFPTWESAVQWTGDIEPGQVLFVGTRWAHHVRTIETSISVSYDFVNQTNLAAYAASQEWAEVLGNRIKRNPDLVAGRSALDPAEIDRSPPVALGRRVMAQVLRSAVAGGEDSETARIRRLYLTHLQSLMAETAEEPVEDARERVHREREGAAAAALEVMR